MAGNWHLALRRKNDNIVSFLSPCLIDGEFKMDMITLINSVRLGNIRPTVRENERPYALGRGPRPLPWPGIW